MIIRRAAVQELDAVHKFYDDLIDEMINWEYPSGWTKGIYPSRRHIEGWLNAQTLWVADDGGEIIGAMIADHCGFDSYENADWAFDATPEEVLIVHALGVKPSLQKKGIGGMLVEKLKDIARDEGLKAVRLDVVFGNPPADRLYMRHGFKYTGEVKMWYPELGWSHFNTYEFNIV